MPDDRIGIGVGVTGQAKFREFSAKLKLADKDIVTGFRKAVQKALKPLGGKIRESALRVLPKRGGLAARVAAASQRTSIGVNNIRLATKSNYEIGKIDKGVVRHPVFGHMNRWVAQEVHPGFWSTPVQEAGPDVRVQVEQVLEDVKRKLDE